MLGMGEMRAGTGKMLAVLLLATVTFFSGFATETALAQAGEPRVVLVSLSAPAALTASSRGEDAVARRLSEALDRMLARAPGLNQRRLSATLGQLELIHGCDSATEECLQTIAGAQSADVLIAGMVSPEPPSNFRILLRVVSGQSLVQIERILGSSGLELANPDSSRSREIFDRAAQEILSQIDANWMVGSLLIRGARPGQVVEVDGQRAGIVSESGELRVASLSAGRHTVRLLAVPSRTQPSTVVGEYQSTVGVSVGEENFFDVIAEPSRVPQQAIAAFETPVTTVVPPMIQADRSNHAWVGYALLGVAAASLAVGIVSSVQIDALNRNPFLVSYRDSQPPSVANVCNVSSAPTPVRNVCSDAQAYEILQWTFYSAAAVSAVVGTWVVISESSSDGEASNQQPIGEFRVNLSPANAGLEYSLRF